MQKGYQHFNLLKLLTNRMRSVPAWRDLAEETNKVFEREIEGPRRRLANIRDSILYRKDERINDLTYTGEGEAIDTGTGEAAPIEPGTRLPSAKILAVQENSSADGSPIDDYLLVEFTLSDGRTVHWRMPVTAPQERSSLIQNAYMLGFDFFNTQLTDQDYQRMQEFISMYWPEENGTEMFVKFMSFVKNIRFDAIPLWSYDDDTEIFPALEPFQENRVLPQSASETKPGPGNMPPMVPTWKGGEWYLTSHVELRYDPIRDALEGNIDIHNPALFQGIEQLFYYFAPIHLVLARVVAAIDLYFDFFMAACGQEMSLEFAKTSWEPPPDIAQTDLQMDAGQSMTLEYGQYAFSWPVLDSYFQYGLALTFDELHFAKDVYLRRDMQWELLFGSAGQEMTLEFARQLYNPPPLKSEILFGSAGQQMTLEFASVVYQLPEKSFVWEILYGSAGQEMTLEFANAVYRQQEEQFVELLLMIAGQMMTLEFARAKGTTTAPKADPVFPDVIQRIITIVIGQLQQLYFARIDRRADFIDHPAILFGGCGQEMTLEFGKASGQRRLAA